MAVRKDKSEKRVATDRLADMHAKGFRDGCEITEARIAAWLRLHGGGPGRVFAKLVESGAWETDRKKGKSDG